MRQAHHGTVSHSRPLWSTASLVAQQKGLNTRSMSAPHSSQTLMGAICRDVEVQPLQCVRALLVALVCTFLDGGSYFCSLDLPEVLHLVMRLTKLRAGQSQGPGPGLCSPSLSQRQGALRESAHRSWQHDHLGIAQKSRQTSLV